MTYLANDIDVNHNTPRYIPSSRTNNMITNMALSRIEPTRESMNLATYSNIPTTDSPFNPAIFSDVKYSNKPALTTRNRVLTKYENNNPGNVNIALYDTRNNNLNASNVPSMSNNQMQNNLRRHAESKVTLKMQHLIPADGSKNASNGWNYNPYLPISDTNKPCECTTPAILDERMIYHTSERPWNYASDRANEAYKLQRSTYIKERNERQHEADDALFHRTKKDRWVEPKQAYRDRIHQPDYSLESLAKSANKDNERNTLTPTRQQEAFITSRNGFDANDINNLNKDITGNFQPEYTRKLHEIYDRELLKSRMEQFDPDSSDTSSAKGSFITSSAQPFNYITSTISNFFGWNQGGNRDTIEKYDTKLEYDSDGSLSYHFDHNLNTDFAYSLPSQHFDTSIPERFYYKPDHMLVVKDGNLVETYPDEDFSYTAVSAVTMDPLQTGLIRSIALLDNGKFMFVQKRAQDAIFTNDHQPFGDDYLLVEVPIEMLDHKFRERIKKYNTGTKRDKVIELTYEDFIQFSDFIIKHPELQKRLNREQLHYRVRTNQYDSDIVTNFEGKKTFVDEKVYAGLADQMRQRIDQKVKGRIDKDQITSDTSTYTNSSISPLDSSNPTSLNATSFRQIQHGINSDPNFGTLTTQRSIGIKRGQFD